MLGNLGINISRILKVMLRTWGDVTSQKKASFTVTAIRISPLIQNTPLFKSKGSLPLMRINNGCVYYKHTAIWSDAVTCDVIK